ncbi:MAG: S1C family serine protease [Bacilli bacterium]|jgi:serine protease Do
MLSSCELLNERQIKNNIINTVVEYQTMSIEDFQSAIEVAIDRVEDAVIGVTLKKGSDRVSIGSGVIYKREEIKIINEVVNYKYYVITNRHVIKGDNPSETYNVSVYLGDEDKELPATVVGMDNKVDIALITFVHSRLINPVEFAGDEEIKKGSFAIAIGNPDGYDYYGSVTFGVVSSPLRYMNDDTDGDDVNDFSAEYLQHDVAINPGNSGGGLFNIYGQLIGINTLKLVNTDIDNMGFAIPHRVVKIIVTEYLEKGKTIVRPRLGVLGIEVRSLTEAVIESEQLKEIPDIYGDEQQYGIYVSGITENSSIDGSGIEIHDIILEVDDIKITRTNIITAKLNSLVDYQVGDEVTIKYYNRSTNSIKTTKVTLKSVG